MQCVPVALIVTRALLEAFAHLCNFLEIHSLDQMMVLKFSYFDYSLLSQRVLSLSLLACTHEQLLLHLR